ncbi:MAG: protein-L-isoaspartate(D-aspartate) O-methyltransferase [Planctomycetota bacterium]|jgi:protein-L-isoaspartate(D-aspartate) O-methyltransferase|nr:protein-L-isoaspartate(D-aspartate) O-methyltransferase [Planctomycetota bacterium]MDP6990016.1 protein-L-isoaspartate(D-aspartate) O-methyltransferase [Planctomycetota bacterium]
MTLLHACPATERRHAMVEFQLRARGIEDPGVLAAMGSVERELFVPSALRARAYDDEPLPIGFGQTISQPYVVALMVEALELSGDHRVLEIGTGSGYAAAVKSMVAAEVWSVERNELLAARARATLDRLRHDNVRIRSGDGACGWPGETQFDAISIAAATGSVPAALLEHLAPAGRMVLPLGDPHGDQKLVLVTREGTDYREEELTDVRFVPLVG